MSIGQFFERFNKNIQIIKELWFLKMKKIKSIRAYKNLKEKWYKANQNQKKKIIFIKILKKSIDF